MIRLLLLLGAIWAGFYLTEGAVLISEDRSPPPGVCTYVYASGLYRYNLSTVLDSCPRVRTITRQP
jgi:hypothetical protein